MTAGVRAVPRWRPETARHSWKKVGDHHRRCRHCEVEKYTRNDDRNNWWYDYHFPDNRLVTTFGGGRQPPCPGPPDDTASPAQTLRKDTPA